MTARAIHSGPDGEEWRRYADLSAAEVARAVPTGSRRIRSQREALRRGLSCPDLAGVRADFREHLCSWWRVHVNHASWGGEGRPPRGTSEPTRARVCALAGMSESTYKACRRWWTARGYIAIARPGRTPDFRPGVLRSPQDRNVRQAYVLCIPRCGRTDPAPSSTQASTLTRPLSKSRRDFDRFPAREACASGSPRFAKTGAPRSPVLARGMFAAITDGWWAHITAPFASWTAADLVHAVDHWPGGRQHRTQLANIRHPAAWLRWRLSHWLASDGTPLPSPSQARAAAAEAHRAALIARERDPVFALFAARREQLRRHYHYDRADDAPALGTVVTRPRSVPGSWRPAPAHLRETKARTAPELPRWWTDAVEAAVRAAAEHERGQFSVPASHPGRVTSRSTRR